MESEAVKIEAEEKDCSIIAADAQRELDAAEPELRNVRLKSDVCAFFVDLGQQIWVVMVCFAMTGSRCTGRVEERCHHGSAFIRQAAAGSREGSGHGDDHSRQGHLVGDSQEGDV